ncbi:lytic transglycosylase F [Terasakiispira papahanaumokuakeensis]|uniref:Membrane-bound lytic murein transglycosylase F n=1 Tax=Terasakiispira papahanaumokuakeensis TaxID=197479 RepID=A0A1E2V6B3_9GAMM|nr:membrane-bound lytic murein transglycosylase MltF [Terasakiispira papahanaumokuakeensis]ODC02392.1 lytic transglycosylase F [Terasakiispira papahanaumokuakeensis]
MKKWWWALLLLPVLLTGCRSPDPLEEILKRGKLQVLMRNTPSVYYENRNGPAGFEYELVKAFADHLGVQLEVISGHSISDMETALLEGQADMAAGGLGITLDRMHRFQMSEPLIESDQVVVYRRGSKRPDNWEEIDQGQLAVLANTRQAEMMRTLQTQYPALSWRETDELEVTDLLKMVQDGELPYALINHQDYTLNRFFFPRVGIAFEIDAKVAQVWLFPEEERTDLLQAANGFIRQAHKSGLIDEIRDRYYRHEKHIDYVGARRFVRQIREKLPQWEEAFKAAAATSDLDWTLLASVGYQESHWRPRAVSPTGVKGMMMLTLTTAKELGIKNRLDPVKSIKGGARYLRQLYNRLPDRLNDDDRLYMALAAYNVGMGHLEDARRITESQGKDPDQWADVAEYLPLLAKREWYRHTRYGYARGHEPVIYVRNIRRYREILEWYERSQNNFLEMLEARSASLEPETSFSVVPPVL